ncbi:hypothetical protein BB561_000114 [Smittium simulii]|uniref:Chorismate mutase n=1 Tax=Smittium simulii TaxID=133385 RepID=A0A2T9Z0I4_9FUNG|nr:hypothetical protein BB561_000114 [Smittium simulii]
MCKPGDDKNYGSTATRDIECLQALSRRVHYGKFVAEAKFCDPKYHDLYVQLIKNKDRDAIMKLLTNEQVELKLLERLKKKTLIYGQDLDNPTQACACDESAAGVKIDSDLVVKLYKDYVIPLTKEVEVLYLLNRI